MDAEYAEEVIVLFTREAQRKQSWKDFGHWSSKHRCPGLLGSWLLVLGLRHHPTRLIKLRSRQRLQAK
jgi:hypothetical protein